MSILDKIPIMFQSSNKFTLDRDNDIHLIDHKRKIESSPIFSTPNAFALLSLLFSSLLHTSPVFFHHLSYRICITPFSCSSKIARDILSLQGEPAYKTVSLSHEFLRSLVFETLYVFCWATSRGKVKLLVLFTSSRRLTRPSYLNISLSLSLFASEQKEILGFHCNARKKLGNFQRVERILYVKCSIK